MALTEALAAAAGAAPAAEGDGAGGDKTEKETETEDAIPASEVIEEEDKGANERWKTVKPACWVRGAHPVREVRQGAGRGPARRR